jgi:hypothetical protein
MISRRMSFAVGAEYLGKTQAATPAVAIYGGRFSVAAGHHTLYLVWLHREADCFRSLLVKLGRYDIVFSGCD